MKRHKHLLVFLLANGLLLALSCSNPETSPFEKPYEINYHSTEKVFKVGTPAKLDTPVVLGNKPMTFRIAPTLPLGLVFDTSTAVISGTPQDTISRTQFSVTAINSAGNMSVSIFLTVLPAAPSHLTYPVDTAAYTVNAPIAGNTPTYLGGAPTGFGINPKLPTGLQLDAIKGTIYGTPTVVSPQAQYVVIASNAGGTTQTTVYISVATNVGLPLNLTTPADNATNVAVTPTLSWNADSEAAIYRFQLSTDNAFANLYTQDSTLTGISKRVTGLSNNTKYYWRVKATSATKTTAWAVDSFTTVAAAPSEPTLGAPSDNAPNVAVAPTLTWNADTGAATYQFQISTINTFASLYIQDSTLTVPAKAITGLSNSTKYYWRVNATNSGGTSAWTTDSFTTIVTIPVAPVQTAPVDNATNVAVAPTLTWNASSGAASCHVQVSTSISFSSTVFDSTTAALSKAINGLSNSTKYYWRVNATNVGGTSAWATDSFTTIIGGPAIPSVTAPADNATNVAVASTLTWNTIAAATSYRVQVSTSISFATLYLQDSALTASSKAISGLSNNTKYYWRVNATNAGGTSAWATDSFTTIIGGPTVPVLTAPTDNATNVAVAPTLTWNVSTGAASYHVQVSTSISFGSAILDSTLAGMSKEIGGLLNSTKYYWRVNATNAGGTSAWSTDSFTTIVAVPLVPVLVSPANNATGVAVSPVLAWNVVTGASIYYVNISTAPDFSSFVKTDSMISPTDTTKVESGLANGTMYYWRVQAKNTAGVSTWSATKDFVTIRQYSLSITAANGSVAQSPNLALYDSGSVVGLKAHPSTGYAFASWSGNAAGTSDTTTIVMNGAKSVTANFAVTYQLTITAGIGGIIVAPKSSPTSVTTGASTTITAVPGADTVTEYKFWKWTVTSGSAAIADSSFASTTVKLTLGNATIQANFKPLCQFAQVDSGLPVLTSSNAVACLAVCGSNILAGILGDGIFLTKSNGSTWTSVNSSIKNPVCFAVSGGNVFVGTHDQGIFRSTDSGSTWTPDDSGLPSAGDWIDAVTIDGTTIFTADNGAGVFRSLDNGLSWNLVKSAGYANCLTAIGDTILAGTQYGGVLLSTNGGTTWTSANSGLSALGVTRFSVIGNSIFATTFNPSSEAVSTNYGATWTSVSNSSIGTLAFSGDTVFSAAGGVFLSTNNGASWIPANSGVQNAGALAVCGGYIFAGTYSGGGIYRSPLP